MIPRRTFAHQRQQPGRHAGHVRGDEHRVFAVDALETHSGSREWALVRDRVARERNAIRALRQGQLRRVRCEHDHDLVAGIGERAERAVEERRAVERFDDLRPTEASGGAARE